MTGGGFLVGRGGKNLRRRDGQGGGVERSRNVGTGDN